MQRPLGGIGSHGHAVAGAAAVHGLALGAGPLLRGRPALAPAAVVTVGVVLIAACAHETAAPAAIQAMMADERAGAHLLAVTVLTGTHLLAAGR